MSDQAGPVGRIGRIGRFGGIGRAVASAGWLALAACGGAEDTPTPAATVQAIGASTRTSPDENEDALDRMVAGASDASPLQAPAAASITNRPPRFTGIQIHPGRQIDAGQDVTVIANAVDPEGDEVTVLYGWRVNGELTGETGRVFDTAGLEQGDTVQVVVIASDGFNSSEPVAGPELVVQDGLPRIVSQPAAPGADGVFRYQVRGEGLDGDSNFRYRLVEAPEGMQITQLGGLVRWTPGIGQRGVFPIAIEIEDAAGATATQSFELTLEAPVQAPASGV